MPRLPGLPGPRAARDPSEAPTTTSFQARSADPGDTTTTGTRDRVGRQARTLPAPRRQRTMERRALVAVVALVAAVVGAVALSRSIADVIETRGQVAAAQALNDGIRAQVEAGRQEIEYAQTDAYLRFAARGRGYGHDGREVAFGLREGAPPAPSITPLGDGQEDADEGGVLAGFLDLLLQP